MSDHCKYVRDYCNIGFPIYTNDETAEFIEMVHGEKVTGIPEFQGVRIGGFTVQPFYLQHNGTPNFGYLIEHPEMGKLLFMTDMEYCLYNFSGLKIDHMLFEANYDMELVDRSIPNYEHKLLGHCSIQTTCGIIRVNRSPVLQNVILCHLGAFSDKAEFVEEVRKVAGPGVQIGVADAGKTFDVSKEPF